MKIRYSLNPKYVGKCADAIIRAFHSNFVVRESDVKTFCDEVTKRGFAFSSEFKGKRDGKSFLQAQIAAVDIDRGYLVEDVLREPWVQQNAGFIYTTASHTPEAHRFRIVFFLQTPITEASKYRNLLTGLIDKFGSDESCKDAARMFFGNPGAEVSYIGQTLSADEVEKLLQRAEERSSERTARQNERSGSPLRSRISLPHSLLVRTADGKEMLAWDAPKDTRILCPQHVDSRPSAFVTRNKDGAPVIYCSRCASSFYFDGYQPDPGDGWFDYKWSQVRVAPTPDAPEDFGPITSSEPSRPITAFNERFVGYREPPIESKKPTRGLLEQLAPEMAGEPINAQSDILLIKSPKGSGKTEWLKSFVADLKRSGHRVLFISHRRTLIQSLCKRLGLESYLDVADYYHEVPPHFAICLDSLHKLNTEAHRFDVVVLDESEQLFGHCLSDTFKDHRRLVLLKLQYYLNAAKRSFMLDADLSKMTVNVLDTLVGHKSYRVYINDWLPSGKNIQVFKQKKPNQIVGAILQALDRGDRIFVCSNSKADIDVLAEQIPLVAQNSKLRWIAVTSDNSQKPDVQRFLTNITEEILNYDLVLASPSIATGIDITFPGDRQMIDGVYGIFRPLITTHLEVDQQLQRVRNPKGTYVWIADDEFLLETDPAVIQAEIKCSEEEHHTVLSIDMNTGKPKYLSDDLYDGIYSQVTSMHRASKNRLSARFIEYQEAHAIRVVEVQDDEALAILGASVLRDGKAALEAAQRRQILHSDHIDAGEYELLKEQQEKSGSLTQRQVAQMRRYEIERFYGADVTEELLAFDRGGAGREAVRNVQLLFANDADLRALDDRDRSYFAADRKQLSRKKRVLTQVLSAAGLLDENGAIDTTARVDGTTLGSFLVRCEQNREALTTFFDYAPRADAKKSAVAQLNQFLRLLGLRVSGVGRSQAGKSDRVIYGIDGDRLTAITSHVHRRIERLKEK